MTPRILPASLDEARHRALLASAAAVGGGALLQATYLPAWVSALGAALIAWRLLAAARGLVLPGLALRGVLGMALVALVLWQYGTLNGLIPGTALLVLVSCLKLIETHRRRDCFVAVGTGLLLLLAACLESQDLVRTPLYAAQLLLCCTALGLAADAGGRLRTRSAFRLAARSLALAVPVTVLLFLVFPRLPGGFWSVPRGAEAVTGLSDTLTPGSITRLTNSSDVAFRVSFEAALPVAQARYWRGPVLHDFDGATWRGAQADSGPAGDDAARPGAVTVRQHVLLEASHQRWWFALDAPSASPGGAVRLTHDGQLLAPRAIDEPQSYEVLSRVVVEEAAAAPELPLTAAERRLDTRLPAARNPRTLDFARALHARAASDAEFVRAALGYLRTQGFVYTLDPPPLGPDSVDDLLFRTRRGFCGHYASAFAALMRAGGLPARVVTGYLGGEWNPIGRYLVVRQSDAHAWTEVWLEGRGWTRIDPTAVVEPGRLERSLFDLLPAGAFTPARLAHASVWFGRALAAWDAANAWWLRRVLSFDSAAQRDLLASLGLHVEDVTRLGWLFVLVLSAWLAWLGWAFRGNAAAGTDRLGRAYLRLCTRLARHGQPRAPHWGPLDYAGQLESAAPALAHRARPLLEQYAQLRYGAPAAGGGEAAALRGLELAIRRLRL